MANIITEIVNGVETVLLDVSDTTATEADVIKGKVFTKQDGTKGTGTLEQGSYETWDGSYANLQAVSKKAFNIVCSGYATMMGYKVYISNGETTYIADYDDNPITEQLIGGYTETDLTISFSGGSGNDLGRVAYTTDGTDPSNSSTSIVLNSGNTLAPISAVYIIPYSTNMSNIKLYVGFED